MPGQHFARDLGVARLVRADQTQARAAENRDKSVEKQDRSQPDERKQLGGRFRLPETLVPFGTFGARDRDGSLGGRG